MLDVASGSVRQLTFSAKSDSSPRWAPDGRSIAFLSDRDGTAQLYLLPMSGGEAERITNQQGPDRLVPLVAGWPAPRLPDARGEDRRPAAARQRQGRCARRREGGSSGAGLDGRPRVARDAADHLGAVPHRTDRVRARRRSSDRRGVGQARTRTDSTKRSTASTCRTAASPRSRHRADRWARWRSRPTARRSRTSARASTARRRTTSACSRSPAAPRETSPASTHRSADQPAAMDRQPARCVLSVARGFQTSRRRSVGDAMARASAARRPRRQPVRVRARVERHVRLRRRNGDARAPELWIEDADAVPPVRSRRSTSSWTTRPVVAPEFVKYKSADGTEIEAALLEAVGSVWLSQTGSGSSRPLPSSSSSTAARPAAGATPSSRGDSCSSRADTRCCIPTFAARPATGSASSR